MNYNISQILNFEQCNAGIPLSLVKAAAVAVTRESWQNDRDLADAVHNETLDYSAEYRSVNESLADAGCEDRIDEADYREAMADWVDMETIRGNC
jgi:hypothetical protein